MLSKTKRRAVLCAAALFAALLSGCATETPTPPTASQTPTPPSAPPSPVYDDSLITELYELDGEYTDSVGNKYVYSYHVPRLEDDTEDAARLNSMLEETVGGQIESELSSQKDGLSIVLGRTSWESRWHGSIVSVCVTLTADWDITDYVTFCYDFASGKEVTLRQVLAALEIDESAFLEGARKLSGDCFDEHWGEASGEFREEQREWTLSDENVNLDVKFLWTDGDRLELILPIASPAGAGWYYHRLELPKAIK